MQIEVRFPAAPRTQMRKNVIDMCEKMGGSVHENIMRVVFSSGCDPNIGKIINQISTWSGVKMFVEGNPIDFRECKGVLRCHLKSECEGICSQYMGEFYIDSANNMISKIMDRDPLQEGFPDRYFGVDEDPERYRLYLFLTEVTPNNFLLDKDKMYDEILNMHELQSIFCDKFSKEKIYEKIQELPSEFDNRFDSPENKQQELDGFEVNDLIDENIELAKLIAEEVASMLGKSIAKEILAELKNRENEK